MRWLFVWLALAGCKHLEELQAASKSDAATAAQTETHEVKQSGPEIIALSLDEYQQLCPGPAPRAEEPAVGGAHQATPASQSGAPVLRHLEAVIYRGPSLDDLRSLSSLQSKVNTALELKEEKKSGPAGLLGLLGGLWPVVLIGAAVLAGFVIFKLRPPWLSFLFRLLGRTP